MSHDGTTLVTGANGFIGSHLVDHLVNAGARVRALVRPKSDLRFLNPAAEAVVGDVARPFRLLSAVRGVRTVFHVAGVVATFRARTFFEVNETGTRTLLNVCRKECPDLDRFVLVSSLAAAGPSRDGRPVREEDRPRPVSRYGASKLAGERTAFGAAGGIPVTVVRPPVVYGPRDRDMLTFYRLAGQGLRPSFRREKFYSMIHVRDLVRGIVLAGTSPAGAGRTYFLADGKAYALSHLLDLIEAAVGRRARRVPVPVPLLPLLAGAADALASGLGLPLRPLADKVREMRPDAWIADPARAAAELGFRTTVRLDDGIREAAAFYRASGWIPGPRRGV